MGSAEGKIWASVQLPSVTVIAKKVPPSFSNTQITASVLQSAQETTLVEALQQTPGVHVVQTGGVGKNAQLFVRGGNPEHVLVRMDGLPAHDPSTPNGGFDFGQLETESFETVEVLRGPQAAIYGSQATAGVVNIQTKQGLGKPSLGWVGEAGSHQSYRQSASVQGTYPQTGNDKADFYMNASHRLGNNPPSTPMAYRTLDRQYQGDPYGSQSFVSHLGLKSPSDWRLGLINRHQESRSRYVNEFNLNPNSQDKTTYDLHRLALERNSPAQSWNPLFQIGFLKTYRHTGYDRAPFLSPFLYRGQSVHFSWNNRVCLVSHQTLNLGVETDHQTYQAQVPQNESFQASYRTTQAKSNQAAAVIGYEVSPHPRLKLSLWTRGQRHSCFPPCLTYRGSATYHHDETDTDFYTSYGSLAHPPSLYQLFDPDSGNQYLRPETGYGWETGWQQRLKTSSRTSMTLGLVFFQNRLHNLIVGQQLSPHLYRYDNLKHSQTYGFESFIMWRYQELLQIRLDHLYTRAQDLDSKETLLRRPLHKVLLTTTWFVASTWNVSVGLRYDGKQIDRRRFPPYQKVQTTGPFLVRLALNYIPEWKFPNHTSPDFFVRIENLFNRRYQQPLGYEQPGLEMYTGVRITL